MVLTRKEERKNYYSRQKTEKEKEPKDIAQRASRCLWLSNASWFLSFKGAFFSCENLIDMAYCLDEKKVAIINVKSVRCICFDLKEVSKKRAKKKIYNLSLEQHEEIMANC